MSFEFKRSVKLASRRIILVELRSPNFLVLSEHFENMYIVQVGYVWVLVHGEQGVARQLRYARPAGRPPMGQTEH